MRGSIPTPEQALVQREMEWAAEQQKISNVQSVKLIDIDVPFWSLVKLAIMFSLALIPAGIVLFLMWSFLGGILLSLMR